MFKLWLDLELREDIDDYVTLIFSLEKGYNIEAISIHNPSKNELKLLKTTLSGYSVNIPIIITGDVLDAYPEGKDLNPYFLNDKFLKDVSYESVYSFDNFIKEYDISNVTVFCGGSLKTLSLLTERFDVSSFKACIQGGFASYKIVEEKDVLKKFKNRDSVPTWNLNLDLEATNIVLKSGLDINFISKNICHSSFVSLDNVKDIDSVVANFLTNYFEYAILNRKKGTKKKNVSKKCLHDVLALVSIDSDIVKFKPIELFSDNSERTKWWSELKEDSNHKISVSYNYDDFIKKVLS